MSPRASATLAPPQSVTVEATDLKAAAAWAARTLPTRPPVPVLAGLMLTTGDGLLSLAAFDYETYSSIGVEVSGGFDGPLLVAGKMLADIAAQLTGQATLTVDGPRLIVKAGRQVFRLNLMAADDYPAAPKPAHVSGRVEADGLSEMVARASVAASHQIIAQLPLHLVHLVADDGLLTAWATDRYRMARVSIAWSGEPFDVQVPAATLTAALRGMTGPVGMGADTNHLSIEARDRTVTISRDALDPVVMDRLLNAPFAEGFHVDRVQLLDAVTAAKITLDRGDPVRLTAHGGTLDVVGEGDSSGAVTTLDIEGDMDIAWAMNAEYLSSLIGGAPGPRLSIEPSAGAPESRPVRLKGADADGVPDESCTYLLVPIRSAR